MNQEISNILDCLAEQRAIDFMGYNVQSLKKLLDNRITATNRKGYKDYLEYLQRNAGEPDELISALTINVSKFFRNPVVFNYLAERILPRITEQKNRDKETTIRAWSAGCARGEEAYSLAILLNEIIRKEEIDLTSIIFATDIDRKLLNTIHVIKFSFDSIENVQYGLLKKYFSKEKETFLLREDIKNLVSFSFHDLLDKKTLVPPESVFGNFDLVFCRNVLIYFKSQFQDIIFKKIV